MEKYGFCSAAEVSERQRVCDIHILEATFETSDSKIPPSARILDKARAVKKFTRSGSSDLHKAYEPRNLTQLIATARYLISDIWWNLARNTNCVRLQHTSCNRDGHNFGSAYSFVMDRLQAIRQDVVSQSTFEKNPIATIELLKSMVHFYVESMHCITSTANLQHDQQANARDIRFQMGQSVRPLISSWFDLHSHENALSSCITAALSLCSQLPIEIQDLHFESCDDLSANLMLLSVASQLRDLFYEMYVNNVGSCAVDQKTAAATSAVKSTLMYKTNFGSNAVNILRELISLRALSSHTKEQQCIVDDTHQSQLRASTIALTCLTSIRQGNSAGAVRSFMPASASLNKQSSRRHQLSSKTKLMLAAMLHHMLPELRLLRCLQCDLSAPKNDPLDMKSLSRKLWLRGHSLSPMSAKRQGAVTVEATRLLGMPITSTDTAGVSSSMTVDVNNAAVTLKASQIQTVPNGPKGLQKQQQRDLDALFNSRSILMGCYARHSAGVDGRCEKGIQDSWDDSSLEGSNILSEELCGTDVPMSGGVVVGALNDMLLMATCDNWYGPDT